MKNCIYSGSLKYGVNANLHPLLQIRFINSEEEIVIKINITSVYNLAYDKYFLKRIDYHTYGKQLPSSIVKNMDCDYLMDCCMLGIQKSYFIAGNFLV